MAKDHVYHWKHGWIPLTHSAALSKAKGNRKAADKMLEDAQSAGAGIHSREHVAKAALGLSHISNPEHRSAALADVHAAADVHGAHDVLPAALQRPAVTRDLSRTQLADGTHVQIAREAGKGGDVIAVRKLTQNPLTGEVSPAALAAAPYVEHATPDLMRSLGVRGEDIPSVMDLVKGKGAPGGGDPRQPMKAPADHLTPLEQKTEASRPGLRAERQRTRVDQLTRRQALEQRMAHADAAMSADAPLTAQEQAVVDAKFAAAAARKAAAPVDPFREGARQHVDAAKHKVGDAVSIRGEANSRVTVVEIKDGRAKVQNSFQSGAQGTWMPLGKLVPYGADTGREKPMGGRAVPGTGSTGSSIRRR